MKKGRYKRYLADAFVCQNTPFVGPYGTAIEPSVGQNIPLGRIRRFSAGLTLIELIVVLLVIGILAGISIPNFQPFILNQRISSNTNDLVADLSIARSEAVKRAAPVTVCKSLNPGAGAPACNVTPADAWTTGRLIFVDTNSNGVLDANEALIRVRAALEGRSIRLGGDGNAAGTANRVTFRPDGTTNLTAESQWVLCDQRGSAQGKAIVLNTAGRTRIPPRGKNMADAAIVCPP